LGGWVGGPHLGKHLNGARLERWGSVEKRVNEIRELPRPQGQPTPITGWH